MCRTDSGGTWACPLCERVCVRALKRLSAAGQSATATPLHAEGTVGMSRCCVRALRLVLVLWASFGPCGAGHRPLGAGEKRPRHARHHDRWAQRIQYPALHDQGTQRIQYPSLGGRDGGQAVQFPNASDSAASAQIKRCAPGFYREGSGSFLGRCVPCDCNGLSDVCDESSGRCLNCQFNTAGERCERCKEGYYGNAIQRTCKVCPCPFHVPTNSFAIGCREAYEDIQCICRAGYTGERCERCAPGYYGDPLTPGGSCRPCNCNGNGNNCDPRTGVCKNTLEPGDTNTDESCQECDNCAQTLLHDLEQLDDELERVQAELNDATASSTSQDMLRKLEKAVSDTKILVNAFSNAINSQKARVDQLGKDTVTLADDINSLKDKADRTAADADRAVGQIEETHARAKNLNTEIQNMLKKIQALLDRLKHAGDRGDASPNESLTKMLEEAQRMVKDMEDRNFTPQKTAAEKERDEAKKLLDHIQADVTKQLDQNKATAAKIQGLLKDYEAKLKELKDALTEARGSVKQANALNGLNAQGMEELQKRIDALKKEQKTVEDQMSMAENELQKTEDLVKMLTDSKTEYEQLAAQLDGAKTDLTERVNEISKAAAKEDIVVKAEEHARNLEELARDLENAVKNTSGRTEVRNAKDAIDVYKNITDSINAAEAAAAEAKDAADKALDNVKKQNLLERAQDLKLTGDDLLQDAKQADKDLQGAEGELADVKRRLKNANDKKKALEKDLLDAQNELNATKRDDIAKMLDDAKRKAASANDTASGTMDKLNQIRKEINKISVTPVDSNLTNVLNNVDQSVKKLLSAIPQLDSKISEVENLTSQSSFITNITEDIKNIKELIEQARDTANRIVIPMKFAGNGYVEMRKPQDLDDLRAYTSLALSLQRPEGGGDGRRRRRQTSGDVFVLYLGSRDTTKDYIGMYLKSNVLHGVYKLNGNMYTIKTAYISRSASQSSRFDRVELNRIYQDVQMNLTKDFTSVSPLKPLLYNNIGDNNKNLLDLSPSDVVFYVGGYPSNFTPPDSLNFPGYDGCIEFASFNDKLVSLYNFQTAENVNLDTPCSRYVAQLDSSYFEGTGYGRVTIKKTGSTLLIGMSVFTRLENGLLLYMGNENNYFTVTIEKGFLVVRGDLIQIPGRSPNKLFPLTENQDILIVIKSTRDISARLGTSTDPEVTKLNTAKADAPYDLTAFTDYYIGGAPLNLRERFNITMQAFKGCMNNLKQQRDFKPIDESVGISKGCPVESLVSRKAEFSLGSSLSADLSGFSLAGDVTVSVGFRSTESEGLILQSADKDLARGINLALDNGYVMASANSVVWKSNKQYHDGRWHYLTVTTRGGSVGMLIDDDDSGQRQSGSGSVGDTGGSLLLGKEAFKGCISNLYTRRPENLYKPEDLDAFTSSGDVVLDVCTADTPAQLMLDRSMKKGSAVQQTDDSVSACAQPATVQHAYRMGGPVSSLSYSLPLQVLQPRPHFSLDVRTRSMEGLLFLAATRGGHSHLALYMSKGRIRLSVGKQKEIFNREKYNDGKWHSVIFSLEKKKFRLVVDGIRAQDGQLTSTELTSMQQFMSPVYLGSAPQSLHKQLKSKALPKQSISGCLRNFKMNGAPMSHPATNRGAGPCFEGSTQRGTYFSGNGAHAVINDSFVVGSSFELLFNVRPRSLTGLLLHVGNFSRSQYGPSTGHYLSVYMRRGEVVAQANNGKGEFMVSVKPKDSLCDGTFHKISVIKRKNVIQLHVDTVDNYKIGPQSSAISPTKSPLYVGGIPEMSVQRTLPVTSSFVGCIQDMRINGESIYFEKLPGLFGPVNPKECPS